MDLATAVSIHLPPHSMALLFDHPVKLDLEARGEIERVPKVSPQQVNNSYLS